MTKNNYNNLMQQHFMFIFIYLLFYSRSQLRLLKETTRTVEPWPKSAVCVISTLVRLTTLPSPRDLHMTAPSHPLMQLLDPPLQHYIYVLNLCKGITSQSGGFLKIITGYYSVGVVCSKQLDYIRLLTPSFQNNSSLALCDGFNLKFNLLAVVLKIKTFYFNKTLIDVLALNPINVCV